MGSKRNTGKKRRAPEKAGEHRKNEELSKHRKSRENFEKVWCFFGNTRKRKKLRKKLVNTGRRRSSGTTPRKRGALPEKLVKSEKTPEKDGKTPGKSGEPKSGGGSDEIQKKH